jgi:amidohydrolase
MSLRKTIKDLAKAYAPNVIQFRRHIHANPELSYKKFETAKFVSNELKNIGLEPTEGVATTGVTALIKGRNPSKRTIALRADMDALPIVETNDIPYKSKNEGLMHACGHDVHTSSLLGVASILNDLKDKFEGTIKLIFQPGEEVNPGGASLMIKAGVLKNPAPEQIFGQHVMPFIPTGKVGFREGMYMASADEIYMTIKGKGGHAAMPDKVIDPVLIMAHTIIALQQIVSRNADPKLPTVLSFGKVEANGATNIIPDEVKVAGTFRALNEVWRVDAHTKMKKLAEAIAEGMGGTCGFVISKGYPFLVNDLETTKRAKSAAEDFLGAENVVDLDLWMGAEDFAFYSHEIPACFYRLGTGNEAKGTTQGVHTPNFNIDEDALEISIGLMSWIALNELRS